MIHIAIDGPAASGKTSLAHALARRFGCLLVETGKMYRAVALGVERGFTLDQIEITADHNGHTMLNGEDVSSLLQTPALDQASSKIATRPEVRERLVTLQQQIAAQRDVVMEGRDIGTVVLPHATVKLFLEASPQERAARRAGERDGAEFSAILTDIIARDLRDSTRAIAPLNPAIDAIIIDTDQKSLVEVICEAIDLVEVRLGGHRSSD
ncbi:(d)CMP kinase [Candidatus Bipolaricaulota bacterium]|nr:(d)CMP kinase [Candidatus Bipolaricaulota bacterium]